MRLYNINSPGHSGQTKRRSQGSTNSDNRGPSRRMKPQKPGKMPMSAEAIRARAAQLKAAKKPVRSPHLEKLAMSRKAKQMAKSNEQGAAQGAKAGSDKITVPLGDTPKGNVLKDNNPNVGEVQEKLKEGLAMNAYNFDEKTRSVLQEILNKG